MKRNKTLRREIVTIALPISTGRILHVLSNAIAMKMASQLGKDQLGAATLAFPTLMMVQTLSITIFYALSIKIRYHLGQEMDAKDIGRLVKNGFFLALIVGCIGAFILYHLDQFLLFIGQDSNLVLLTKNYFHFAALGLFPLLFLTVLNQFYIGTGRPIFALFIETLYFPLSILFAYIFVLGHFGSPQLGLGGISLATLFSQTLIIVCIVVITISFKLNAAYDLFKRPFQPNKNICQSILQLGLPIGIQFGGELAAIAVASYLMGYYGVDPLAAIQITNQFTLLIIMMTFGLSQALSLIVSEQYGRGELHRKKVYEDLKVGIQLLLLYSIPACVLFVTQSNNLAAFYLKKSVPNTNLLFLTQKFFFLAVFFIIFDGLRNLLTGVLRGMHLSSLASRINLLTLWCVSLPVGAIGAFCFNGGPIFLRVGFIFGLVLGVVFQLIALKKKCSNGNLQSISS